MCKLAQRRQEDCMKEKSEYDTCPWCYGKCFGGHRDDCERPMPTGMNTRESRIADNARWRDAQEEKLDD